jgi:pimeloyl-ACP methyl ester carboxylesterase
VTEHRADLSLAYDRFGPAGGETPVVLLHAFPLDGSMWRAVADRLAAASVPSIVVDLPGLGASPVPPGPPDLDRSADAVAGLLDRLAVPRAVLAGVSMGGYVALAVVRRHPQLLAGLALVDTKAEADAEPARQNRERVAATVEADGDTGSLAPMIDGLLGTTSRADRPDVVARVAEGIRTARVEGVAWSQRAMAARPDSTPLLAGIGLPSAVLVGAEDTLSPPPLAQEMAAQLPDAVLSVLPRVGHLSPLEDPDAVTAALLALLLRVRPA